MKQTGEISGMRSRCVIRVAYYIIRVVRSHNKGSSTSTNKEYDGEEDG